jgi:glycosyltransferase involved in cell wall biosynthesis
MCKKALFAIASRSGLSPQNPYLRLVHLCVDARMYRASGIGTYLQNLLPTLGESFELTLLGNPSDLAEVNGRVIPTNIPIYSVAELLRFSSLVPRCDVFWSPHYNVPWLPVRAKARLVTIHDVFHLAHLSTLSLPQRGYATLTFRAAARLSDHIITVSEFSRAEIQHYLNVPDERVSVIPNGVNHTLFNGQVDEARQRHVRQKYELPARWLLYVGNVKPHKNLITLVNAFAALPESLSDRHLLIVGQREGFITGDIELAQVLQNDPALAQRIHFTGFVDQADLPELYRLAELFVFPSNYEGFGLPPLEAMACGCPVVASERASLPEICGAAADYANPDSISELADKITAALRRPPAKRNCKIRLGLERAQKYTWASSVAQHERLIRQFG